MIKWRYDSCNCWSADNSYYNETCFKCNGYVYKQLKNLNSGIV